jgi:class 3 adenylate cyclase/CHASE2 domain-containing sensor protein
MASVLADRLTGLFKRFAHLWLALGVGVLVFGFSFLDFYELIELKSYDQRMVARNRYPRLFGPPPVQMPNLATLDVDDQSVGSLGRFEDWDRSYHSRLIDVVGALGASQVGIDFLLLEDSTPMLRESDIEGAVVHSREDVLALFKNPDHALASTNLQWGNVFYAQFLTEAETQDYGLLMKRRESLTETQEHFVEMQRQWTVPVTAEHQMDYVLASDLSAPVDTITSTAKGAGQVQPIPDMDGIVRRNRAVYVYDERMYPALSLMMAAEYVGVPAGNIQIESNRIVLPDASVPGETLIRDIVIPITDRGEILINWAGDFRSSYRHYPYVSIMVFWESYQRDRLAAAVKREFLADPDLLMSLLYGEIDPSELTAQLLLGQASFPDVDIASATQDIAIAMLIAPHVRNGLALDDAFVAALGIPTSAFAQPDRWANLYEGLRVNQILADLFEQNPNASIDDATAATGLSRNAVSRPFSQLSLLMNRSTGQIAPQQYPLWFFERTLDGTPVASRDVLNSRLAQTIKQHFRTHTERLDEVLSTIDSGDPMVYTLLNDIAASLIAEAAGFPEQEYSIVVNQILQAASLEPMIAEGMSFDDVIFNTFGAYPADLPEEYGEYVTLYRTPYDELRQNLLIEQMVGADPTIGIHIVADSLTALNRIELQATNPEMSEFDVEENAAVRANDIAGDFYTMQHMMEVDGEIALDAHPLVFYAIIVDGEPVFPSDFRNTVFFYGITSTGGHDRNPVPFEPRYPMVGMHANLFNQIVTEQFLFRPEPWVNWLVILGLAVIMGLAIPKFSPSRGGIIMVVILGSFVALTVVMFGKLGIWIDAVGPAGVVVLSYLGITVRNYIVEEREKKFIKGAFANYLAPEVVDQIADNPELLALGGDTFEITPFFSDLQGFSTISQALTATQLVELLNEYLTEMCDIIIANDGTVDKFEGDAIIAFFGAPITHPDHATRACLATVSMQERLDVLRPIYYEQYTQQLFQRIGLSTGECVVGNMGSRSRFDYTMMGDTVNLAARLESSAKQYAIYSQIADSTYAGAKDHIEVRELDTTIVVGRTEPMTTYELLSRKGELDPTMAKVVASYHEGLAYYRDSKWEQAIEKYTAAIAADPDNGDKASQVMIDRCQSILSGEVTMEPDWGGVWALTEK